jgi:hypothetical protein
VLYRAQEVQGHIAKTDIDPGASAAWLAIENDALCSTAGSGIALKRVFKPFDWNLRIFNSAAVADAPPNGESPQLPCKGMPPSGRECFAMALRPRRPCHHSEWLGCCACTALAMFASASRTQLQEAMSVHRVRVKGFSFTCLRGHSDSP